MALGGGEGWWRKTAGRRLCRMPRPDLILADLTHSVIGAFYEVYNELGFGFLEPIYMRALELELRERGHRVSREVLVPVRYKTHHAGWQRLDMLVNEKLVIEAKSTCKLHEAAPRQLFNYLRGTHLEVGLLLHFGPKPRFQRLLSENARAVSVSSDSSVSSAPPTH